MPPEEQTYRAFVKEKLISIEEQTKKTNGRVSDLEKKQDRMELRVAIAFTAIAVIIALKFPDLLVVLKLL